MSDESMKRQLTNIPHSVDSTNSSVTCDGCDTTELDSPVNGSTSTSENKRVFLTNTIRYYIDALKFDTDEALAKKASSLVVAELLGRDKNSNSLNKKGKGGGANTKSKSKVTFSANNQSSLSPSAVIDRLNSTLASQQLDSKEQVKRDKSKSSTSTIIREWGKRPMLVESEAPWTPRNRMYQNAIKAVEQARQLIPNGIIVNNNLSIPPFIQQQLNTNNMVTFSQSSPQPIIRYTVNSNLPTFPGTNVPQVQLLPFSTTNSVLGQQQPVLTGISPFPVPVDINNRPLAVAIDPPTNHYVYQQQHPEMLFPSQQQQQHHQTVIYRQLNSQGVWVPAMEQPQLYQHHHQQQQP